MAACAAITAAGARCKGRPSAGSAHCPMHDPARAAERRDRARRAGRSTAVFARLAQAHPELAIEDLPAKLLSGEIDPATVRALRSVGATILALDRHVARERRAPR